MISYERIDAVAKMKTHPMALPPNHDECIAMAREILAYRKAFSDPFGHMNKFFEGKDTGVVWFDKEACSQSDNYIALYRKPTIPE